MEILFCFSQGTEYPEPQSLELKVQETKFQEITEIDDH